jgi:predicted phage terminase large subunit-like protein
MRAKWPAARRIYIEDKANGPAIESALRKSVPGLIMVEPIGSKISRAHAVSGYFEAGNVWLPEAEWTAAYVEEHVKFPVAANDDQVDGTTQALLKLTESHAAGTFKRAMRRVSGEVSKANKARAEGRAGYRR